MISMKPQKPADSVRILNGYSVSTTPSLGWPKCGGKIARVIKILRKIAKIVTTPLDRSPNSDYPKNGIGV